LNLRLARSEGITRELLDQPRPRSAGLIVVLLGIPSLLAWPALAARMFVLHRAGELGLNALFLLLVGALAIVTAYCIVRAGLSNRRAQRDLILRFGALAPSRSGEPPRCHACGAGLNAPTGKVLACCSYCRAVNVLGFDARKQVRTNARDQQSLEKTLATRRAERKRWLFSSALSAVALVVASVIAFV
jgi:hypothetical protein